MGSRSRKRGRAGAPSGPSTRAERDSARRERAQEAPQEGVRRRPTVQRPQAPWGSFPLTELVILLGMVLAVGGFIVGVEDGRGRTMFGAGVVLGALGGLELAIRDHFAGYRSHTTLLSGVAAFVVITVIVLVLNEVAGSLPGPAVFLGALIAGAIAFGLVFRQLRRVFQERSGGLSFR